MSEPVRTLPIDAAAQVAGVHAKTVRRWIARGLLEPVTGPRGRLVSVDQVLALAALRAPNPDMSEPARAFVDIDARTDPDKPEPVQGLPELVSLVERQQQTIMELAGRVGWLQSENHRLAERVALLEAPAAEPVPEPAATDPLGSPDPAGSLPVETPQPSPEPTNGPVRASERPMRPWWQRWVLWVFEPAELT